MGSVVLLEEGREQQSGVSIGGYHGVKSLAIKVKTSTRTCSWEDGEEKNRG